MLPDNVTYEPTKPKPSNPTKRSWFLDGRKNPVKCGCGGLIIGLKKFEFVLPSHHTAVREGRIVGGCEYGIINFTED